jgi:small conductance mechanosensitive channel
MNIQDIPFSSDAVKTLLYIGLTLLIAVVIDNVMRAVIKGPKKFKNRRARNVASITRNILTIVIYTIAGYNILSLLNINLTPLLASASIIGIILGIGARSVIEDFVNGLFFLSLDSMVIGDYIKIGDLEGYVEVIGARTLSIKSLDGAMHIIPNSQVKGFTNYSTNKANVLIDIPVKTNQDIKKTLDAANTALELLKKDQDLADTLFAGSIVNGIEEMKATDIMIIRVTLITYPVRRWDVKRKYQYLIKKEFEKDNLLFA